MVVEKTTVINILILILLLTPVSFIKAQTHIEHIYLECIFKASGFPSKWDQQWGPYVTGIGDQNDDGFNDILVCSGHLDDSSHSRIDLYFGGNPMDTIPDLTFRWPPGMKGNTLEKPASAGDFNGDGYTDFILYRHTDGSIEYVSTAFLFYGGPSLLDTIPDLIFEAKDKWDLFTSRAGIGDINADGFDDICITVQPSRPDLFGCIANIYYGSTNPDTIPDLCLAFDSRFLWLPANYHPGDLNGDGFIDLYMGGKHWNYPNPTTNFVHVYYGGPLLDTPPDVVFDERNDHHLHLTMNFNIVGDVNGDGFDDLAIESKQDTLCNIYYGSPDFDKVSDRYIQAVLWGSFFGYLPAALGDINNDGFDDILTGAYWNMFDWGEVDIFQGQVHMDQSYDIFFPTYISGIGRGSGADIGWCGDVNGDGYDDVLFSANDDRLSTDHPNKARVYIYAGRDSLRSNNTPAITHYWPEQDTILATVKDTLMFILSGNDPYDNDLCRIGWYLNNAHRPGGSPTRYSVIDTFYLDIPYLIDWRGYTKIKPGINEVRGEVVDRLGEEARKWIVFLDTSAVVGIVDDNDMSPYTPELTCRNYPNPFNASTCIQFNLPESKEIAVEIYDMRGQVVFTFGKRTLSEGYNELTWNGRDNFSHELSSGIYFYCIKMKTVTHVGKMLFLK